MSGFEFSEYLCIKCIPILLHDENNFQKSALEKLHILGCNVMLNIAIFNLFRDLYLLLYIILLFEINNKRKLILSQTDAEKIEEIEIDNKSQK